MSNIFWIRSGVLFTPRLNRCGVAGVIRQIIIERLAPDLGLMVKEGDYSLDALYTADEILMSNSLMGIRPVAHIGCHHKKAPVYASQLQQMLESIDA